MQQEADKVLESEAIWDNKDQQLSAPRNDYFHDFLHTWKMRWQAIEVTQVGSCQGGIVDITSSGIECGIRNSMKVRSK